MSTSQHLPHPIAAPVAPPLVPAHPRARTALVLGILVMVGLVPFGPLAWHAGAAARRDIDREPLRWTGRGDATAGMVMGMIGTALLVVGVLLAGAVVAVMAVLSTTAGAYG
jgi:amino acid transporter